MPEQIISAGAHAFGDGTHPTTRGVLELILGIDPEQFSPAAALDMGAGSGILSFAIAEKFHCPVLAVDVEASAVAAIEQNARANDTPAITALRADGFDHPSIAACAPYDLIVMNILAEPLVKLARGAAAHLATGGLLLISGLLQWQESQIREAYQLSSLELSARVVIGDWVTLGWQRVA